MSVIFAPGGGFFSGLPASDRSKIFAHGKIIRDSGDPARNKSELAAIVRGYQSYAEKITQRVRHAFTPNQLRDLDERPCVAVIADGATIHEETRNEIQKELQKRDHDKAFRLGKALSQKGYRVVLPGYLGLCASVIKGVRAGGGHYIVATTKSSLNYDGDRPLLPETEGNGLYIVTNTLAESKSILFALSNNLVYLPGGLNTADIFTDHFTLEQTGMIKGYRLAEPVRREIITLNDDGFWDSVFEMTEHMISSGFADRKPGKDDSKLIRKAESIGDILNIIGETVYPPEPWQPGLFGNMRRLFIPSNAITLSADLSRPSVFRQIAAIRPRDLTGKLTKAKKNLRNGEAVDPILQPFCENHLNAAVYCGSRDGHDPAHREAATGVGALLRELGYGLIYGGSTHGVMGATADGYIGARSDHPPHILAITPFPFLTGNSTAANEGFHLGITATIGVPGMQERKMLMTTLSDVTIMLSGGWGSLDETLEELRLHHLDVKKKKMIIFNVNGYWDKLHILFDEAIRRGYMSPDDLKDIVIVKSIPELRQQLLGFGSPRQAPLVAAARPAA